MKLAEPPPTAAPVAEPEVSPPSSEHDHEDFLERLKARDPEAHEHFVREYFPSVHALVRRLVGNEHLAEDLTQEVFLGMGRTLDRLDPQREILPWLYAIARNKVCDHWRSPRVREAHRESSVERDSETFELPPSDIRPELECASNEQAAHVREVVWCLPESLRTVVVLRVYEGLSFAVIGRMLGLHAPTARKRYSRALALLRQRL